MRIVKTLRSTGRAITSVAVRRQQSSFVSSFNASVESLPMREAVRYVAGNVKVTASEFNAFAESQANALFEYGFASGDTLAIWMKESMEKHVTLVAAAKVGLKVVDIDISICNKEELRVALDMTDCKSIIFDPIVGDIDFLKILRQAIPEFFSYDDTMGQPFH